MKKIIYFLFVSAIGSIAIVSCGPTIKVTSDYDKAANFSQYKTFSMLTVDSGKQSISQLNQNRLTNAIRSNMIAKGFTEKAAGEGDLTVTAAVILKDKKSISSNTDYYGYGGMYRPYGWGGGMGATGYTTYNVQEYKDGSVIIDIADAKSKSLIWEGIGNSEIDKPLKDPDTEVPAAVTKIMASFPPGAAKK